ncbi:MAG: DUF2079 domain-containing protein, partial [Bdellovibrionota bacterium]
GDASRYMTMAEHPGTITASPWGYRIAVPYLVALCSKLSGLSLSLVFRIFQYALFSGMGLLIYLHCRKIFRSEESGVLCCLTWVLSTASLYHLHNFAHVGIAEHLLIALGLIQLLESQYQALVLTLLLSALVKETIGPLLFVLAVLAMAIEKRWTRKNVACVVVGIVGNLGIYFLLRSGAVFHGELHSFENYTSFYTWTYVKYCYEYWNGPWGALQGFKKAFNLGWVFFFIGSYRALRSPRHRTMGVLALALMILCCSQVLLATDVFRMAGVGAAGVALVSGLCFEKLSPLRHLLIALLFGIGTLQYNNGVETARGGRISLWLIALALAVLCILPKSRIRKT